MPEATFKSQLEQQGYKIKTFKVSGGQCYEIYGFDKAGKKAEIYLDPVPAAGPESKGAPGHEPPSAQCAA